MYDNRVLSSGCTAADTIINTQGKLTVLSGAKITGPLEIQGYGKVRIKNGGIVDLDISNRSPENAVLLKGWDGLTLVDPDNAITLTVNASDQQTGNYNLATRFYTSPEDFVISVVDTENTQLGTLTIGGNIDLGNKNFSLYVENNQPTALPDRVTEDKGLRFWRKGPTASDFDHEDCLPNFVRRAEKYFCHLVFQWRNSGEIML